MSPSAEGIDPSAPGEKESQFDTRRSRAVSAERREGAEDGGVDGRSVEESSPPTEARIGKVAEGGAGTAPGGAESLSRGAVEAKPIEPDVSPPLIAPASTVSLEDVQAHDDVQTFISLADRYLGELGYTEHGFRHANLVSKIAFNILTRLGHEERMVELAAIAGYLHDMGNFVSRTMHSQTGAVITYEILHDLGMTAGETGIVLAAIGNHEEEFGNPVNPAGAALIIADKSDVHRSRVRIKDPTMFDIHDRVNHAVEHSFLRVDSDAQTLTLELTIDTQLAGVMEYFEIFLTRMVMCKRAAEFLECQFKIDINGTKLL